MSLILLILGVAALMTAIGAAGLLVISAVVCGFRGTLSQNGQLWLVRLAQHGIFSWKDRAAQLIVYPFACFLFGGILLAFSTCTTAVIQSATKPGPSPDQVAACREAEKRVQDLEQKELLYDALASRDSSQPLENKNRARELWRETRDAIEQAKQEQRTACKGIRL